MAIFPLEIADLTLKSVRCLGAGYHLVKRGDQEERNIGGDQEERKIAGDQEERKIAGDMEDRTIGGDLEERKIGGMQEQFTCIPHASGNGFVISTRKNLEMRIFALR